MKKTTFLMAFLLLISWQGMAQTTLYLTTSGGSFTTEKWVDITDGPNGTGTVLWAQGDGTYGNGEGLVTDSAFTIVDGTTYYINCYDRYADSWDGTTYEIRTAPAGGGILVVNNGGVSPDDGTDNDAASTWEVMDDERESSEAFSYTPAACLQPGNLGVNGITPVSANLTWDENGTANTWDIEWGVSPYTATGTPTITGTMTNPHSLTGLTAETSYDYYVRADCGGSGASTWVGPFTFYTGYCTPSSTDGSTYVDNFSTSNGATNISNLASGFTAGGYFDGTAQAVESFATGTFDFNAEIVGGTAGFAIWVDWNNDLVFDDASEKVFNTTTWGSGPFTGTITVPGAAAMGDYRMRITTDWNDGNPAAPCGDQARAEFEDYTITVGTAPSCLPPSALAATNIDGFSADLGWTENGTASAWDIEWGVSPYTATGTPTITGTGTNPHNLAGLTPSTSYDYYVRADCGGETSTWVGPFNFSTTIACPAPTALMANNLTSTSADLGWTENGTANTWDIEYGVSPYTATGTPTVTGTTTNPHNLSGLTPSTSYDYYVRTDCGGPAGTSTWSGPFTFTTNCIPPVVSSFPWTEDFDAETTPAMPCGWIVDNANADAYTWETGTNLPNSGVNAMQVRWNGAEAANDWAFTPELSLTGSVTYQLSFAFAVAGGTFPEKLKVMYGGTQSSAGMTDLLFDSTMTNTAYETATMTFTPPTTGSYFVGFHNYSDADMFRVYVDDVTIDIATSISENMNVNNISIFPNPTTGVFTISGNVKNASVNVMNIQGKSVYQNSLANNNTTIDLRNRLSNLSSFICSYLKFFFQFF